MSGLKTALQHSSFNGCRWWLVLNATENKKNKRNGSIQHSWCSPSLREPRDLKSNWKYDYDNDWIFILGWTFPLNIDNTTISVCLSLLIVVFKVCSKWEALEARLSLFKYNIQYTCIIYLKYDKYNTATIKYYNVSHIYCVNSQYH